MTILLYSPRPGSEVGMTAFVVADDKTFTLRAATEEDLHEGTPISTEDACRILSGGE